jgi:uncharacterized protein YkwD
MGVVKFFSWRSLATWRFSSINRQDAKERQANRPARLHLETLETREVLTLNPTGYEQEMLELLNHMRTDPAGELHRLLTSTNPIQSADANVQAALDYYGVSGTALASAWASLRPVQPVAWNDSLMTSSHAHNQAMIAADQQSHQLPGEASLGTRITEAGYTNWTIAGENIYAYANSVFYGHAGFAIDWGPGLNGMQNPAGHRNNMMNGSFREVGIAVTQDNNPNTDVGPYVITQDFGNRSTLGNPYLLGAVYNDINHDGRYEAGEGLGGVTVTVRGTTNSYNIGTMSAGGYQLQVPAGSYAVTFSGPGLATPITQTVTVGTANVMLDAFPGMPSGGTTGNTGNGTTTVNHAPVLNTANPFSLNPLYHLSVSNPGTLVSALIGNSITDQDAGALRGIAVTGLNGTASGTWQFSLDGGRTWINFGATSSSAARLLRPTDVIRFVPRAGFTGWVSLQFRAWDQTSGRAGGTVSLVSLFGSTVGGSTAFSSASGTAWLLVW